MGAKFSEGRLVTSNSQHLNSGVPSDHDTNRDQHIIETLNDEMRLRFSCFHSTDRTVKSCVYL
mgnify:CR=1 FL=1